VVIWLDSGSISNSSQVKASGRLVFESSALQCEYLSSHSRQSWSAPAASGEVCRLWTRDQETIFIRRTSSRARDRSSPAADWRSSATRSSLITILLLQPVFGRPRDQGKVREDVEDGWFWEECEDQEDPDIPNHARPMTSDWQDDKCDDDDDRRPSVGPWTGAHQHWGAAILGPRDGAHPVLLQLLSSATRSSLITILLLQPVFFLRSASRPDPSYCMCASGWRK